MPGITRLVTRAVSDRDFTDLAPHVFAAQRNVRFREGEYAVTRESVVAALRELDAWVQAHEESVTFAFEVRFVVADDIWLSPAYQREVAYVAFHQYHRPPHERFFTVGVAEPRQRYPRFDDFVAMRDEVDPARVFANPYLERVQGA